MAEPADGSGAALFPDRIETERLVLDRLSTETVDPRRYYEVCSSDRGIEDVTRYTPWDPHETPAESLAFLEGREEAWAEGRSADYAIRPRAGEPGAGELAGASGLGIDWERRLGSLGIWLRKRFWSRGYSGERAEALVELAFDRLDLAVVDVAVRADNEKSRRAVERYVDRLGGRRDGRFRNRWAVGVDDPVDEIRYSISRDEYRRATGAGRE